MKQYLEIEEALRQAVAGYKEGHPVVVLDEDEDALHGEGFLKTVGSLSLPMHAVVLRNVPRSYFEASDWPELLEAARQVFFLKNPRFGGDR